MNPQPQPELKPYNCPCTIADKPCHPRCTCVTPYSSVGCACCARYGSAEQRKHQANHIVDACTRPALPTPKKWTAEELYRVYLGYDELIVTKGAFEKLMGGWQRLADEINKRNKND